MRVIIGMSESGEVAVFDDIEHVLSDWTPYPMDVASELIVFYDADGVWLEPILSRGPRRWFGLRAGIETFVLQRNHHPGRSVDPIGLRLFEATSLAPNRYFGSLEELRARFPWHT